MSLSYINQADTVAYALENGVVAWSNPRVDLIITSEGEVFYTNGIKPSLDSCSRYKATLNIDGEVVRRSANFVALYAYMVLGVPLMSRTVVRLDETKPYALDNVQVVKKHSYGEGFTVINTKFAKEPPFTTNYSYGWMKQAVQPAQQPLFNSNLCQEVKLEKALTKFEPKYYSVIPSFSGYRTEDFTIFRDKLTAESHQSRVRKAKEVAKIALNYGSPMAAAEALFLNEMKYCGEPIPFHQFNDVMQNNDEVIPYATAIYVVFDKLEENGLEQSTTYGLPTAIYGYRCSLDDAEAMQEKLEDYKEARDEYKTAQSKVYSLSQELKEWSSQL